MDKRTKMKISLKGKQKYLLFEYTETISALFSLIFFEL